MHGGSARRCVWAFPFGGVDVAFGEVRRLSCGPRSFLLFGVRTGFARIGPGLCTRWNLRALRILGAAWKDGACAICSVEELHNCPEEKCTADLHEGAVWRCAGSCEDDDAGFAVTMQNYGYDGCEQVPAVALQFGMTISEVCDFTPMCARTCAA